MKNNLKPTRADMAINFYCYVKIEGAEGLICYDYNPVWDTWYPFYDDVNKTPVLHSFSGETLEEQIAEHAKVMPIDLSEKVELARQRFCEIFNTTCIVRSLEKNAVTYEVKYSKSQSVITLYRLYNFVITDVAEPQKLITPKNLKHAILNEENSFSADGNKLVTNADVIIAENLQEIKEYIMHIS